MTRAQAKAAIDEAFADGLKNLFSKLVSALETGTSTTDHDDATQRFRNGLAFHDEAHSRALAVVETIFLPE